MLFTPTPHAHSLQPRPLLRLPILLFQVPVFSPALRLINRRQPHLEHLQTHVSPKQPPPNIDGRNRPIVLIALVHVRSNTTIQYI